MYNIQNFIYKTVYKASDIIMEIWTNLKYVCSVTKSEFKIC